MHRTVTMRKIKSKPKARTSKRVQRDGNDMVPPHQYGSQQLSTQLRVRERIQYRTVKAIIGYSSTAGGVVTFNVCTNAIYTNSAVGAGSIVAIADTSFAAQYELFKVKKVEIIWEPTVPTSTAVPNLVYCYDSMATSADFATPTIATVVNYANSGRYDPRLPAGFTYSIRPVSQSISTQRIANGGWFQTSQIGTGSDNAYTVPGTINISGTGLGVSTVLGRFEVVWLVALKGLL